MSDAYVDRGPPWLRCSQRRGQQTWFFTQPGLTEKYSTFWNSQRLQPVMQGACGPSTCSLQKRTVLESEQGLSRAIANALERTMEAPGNVVVANCSMTSFFSPFPS